MMDGVDPLLRENQWTEEKVRSLLITELAKILRIDRSAIDPARSFDELGLDSTDAVVVVGFIEEKLGIELPPELLLQHRTVDDVLRAWKNGTLFGEHAGSLEDGSIPVFLFPGGGGRDQPELVRFRAECSPSLNLEVVRAGDWREWIERDLSFRDLAGRACQQIQDLVPEGRVLLAGYSQGGQLAYATAHALIQAGRSVGFVGLLDTLSGPATVVGSDPSRERSVSANGNLSAAREWIRRGRRYFRAALQGTDEVYLKGRIRVWAVFWLWQRCRSVAKSRKLLSFLSRHGRLFRGAGGVRLNRAIQMRLFGEMWRTWCVETSQALPLHAPVTLFRSDEPGLPDHGWAECCPALSTVPIRGRHETIFDPEYMEELVAQFTMAVPRSLGAVSGISGKPAAAQ
jgi:thioesterase domain-containing protein/acyl carrier protein